MDISDQPLVSIVISVYNGEQYLGECLDSVLCQTYKKWELVIVNDGSEDGTKQIISEYASKDGRVIFIDFPQRRKLVGCLNAAIYSARGSLIARMDADDIMYPKRLEMQVDFLMRNMNVGVVGSDISIINEKSEIVGTRRYPITDKAIKRRLRRKNPFCHPAVMFRRGLLDNYAAVYSSEYPRCEDYELWIRLHQVTNYFSLNEPLLKYRYHSQQITSKKIRQVHLDEARLIVNSVLKRKLPIISLLFLYSALFHILSPGWLINFKDDILRNLKR
jgi:glycosyltransferase involved in cell wall biosynthesis